MSSIKNYFFYSETALAAYASDLVSGPAKVNENRYVEANMSLKQAEAFDLRWQVLDQIDGHWSGFSAVLLQNRSTGEKVLAIRGTNGLLDIDADRQIFSGGLYKLMPQFMALENYYKFLLTSGKLQAGEKLAVTGHSLGGFLTQAFVKDHPAIVSSAFTFNAPGFGGALTQLLEKLHIIDASASNQLTINVRATDGSSVTAGLGQMLGSLQQVRIDPRATVPWEPYTHSIATLSDTLAVYSAYEELVPQSSVDALATLFVGSHIGGRRLENALDALRTVFVGSSSNDVNSTPTDVQEPIFANLQLLRASAEFQAAKGQVRLVTPSSSFADESIIDSQEATAYRYALLELLPFAVVANSEALNQTLYGAYPTRLSLYNSTTGSGSLTEPWLRDRAAMAETLFVANTRSLPIYYDPASYQDGVRSCLLSPPALASAHVPPPAPWN